MKSSRRQRQLAAIKDRKTRRLDKGLIAEAVHQAVCDLIRQRTGREIHQEVLEQPTDLLPVTSQHVSVYVCIIYFYRIVLVGTRILLVKGTNR